MSILKYAGWGFAFLFAISLFGEDEDKSTPNVQTAYKKTAFPEISPPKPTKQETSLSQPTVTNFRLQPETPKATIKRSPATSPTIQQSAPKPAISQPASVPSPYGPIVLLQPTTMYVDANRLNVRNAPTKQAKVIWTLKRDEAVQVVSQAGEWLGLKSQRYSGWVFGTYITAKPAPKIARSTPQAQTGLSVSRIKKLLIKRSHAYYDGNCPCPYNRTKRGNRCGKRSAYSKPGGQEPLCYARDVTTAMVQDYLARQ